MISELRLFFNDILETERIWTQLKFQSQGNYRPFNSNYRSLMVQDLKNPPAMQDTQETRVQSLGQEDPLEEEMAMHFSILT